MNTNTNTNANKNHDTKYCQSCMMPFAKDPLGDKREHPDYCSYCYNHGKLCYEGTDVKEFQRVCYDNMRSHGMGRIKAKFFTWMIQFAPRWKKK